MWMTAWTAFFETSLRWIDSGSASSRGMLVTRSSAKRSVESCRCWWAVIWCVFLNSMASTPPSIRQYISLICSILANLPCSSQRNHQLQWCDRSALSHRVSDSSLPSWLPPSGTGRDDSGIHSPHCFCRYGWVRDGGVISSLFGADADSTHSGITWFWHRIDS